MRLRRSVLNGPGLHRVRRGRGFSYHDHDGRGLTDEATLSRIKDLVIPPAWRSVPTRTATSRPSGSDIAGRRQYLYHERCLYHERWQEERAEENNSFGMATLLCEHVTVQRQAVEFDFPAKSGVRRTLMIEDAEVVRSVRAPIRLRRPAGRRGVREADDHRRRLAPRRARQVARRKAGDLGGQHGPAHSQSRPHVGRKSYTRRSRGGDVRHASAAFSSAARREPFIWAGITVRVAQSGQPKANSVLGEVNYD